MFTVSQKPRYAMFRPHVYMFVFLYISHIAITRFVIVYTLYIEIISLILRLYKISSYALHLKIKMKDYVICVKLVSKYMNLDIVSKRINPKLKSSIIQFVYL